MHLKNCEHSGLMSTALADCKTGALSNAQDEDDFQHARKETIYPAALLSGSAGRGARLQKAEALRLCRDEAGLASYVTAGVRAAGVRAAMKQVIRWMLACWRGHRQ